MTIPPRSPSPPGRLRPQDEAALAEALARAFRDNPLNKAVIGGGARQRMRSNRAGMRATLVAARARCHVLAAPSDDGLPSGGLIAMAPGTWPLAPPPLLAQLRVLIGQGPTTARRWGEVFDALQAVHPVEPHWYLALLGVDPGGQGCGRGAALVEHWLEVVDRAPTPAYLETDRPELVAFYGRFGFAPIGSEALFGVPVRLLWRPAAA